MSRFRTSILIISMLVIVVAASLLTVLGLYATGAVVTARTELEFTVVDEQKVYDGTPLTAYRYKLVSGEIAEGHEAAVEFIGSQVDSGESASSLSVKIHDKSGYDVTGEYKIRVNSGLLSVSRKEVTVLLKDEEVTYNGSTVTFENYVVTSGDLVSGHKIAGSQNAQLITVNDTLPSDLKPLIFDAAGRDVTANYKVNFDMGKIRVLPRPVTVKPVDQIKVYDGVEINLNKVEILAGSLAPGQYIKKVEINHSDTRYIDVCDEVTRITDLVICQRVGLVEVDVTENYDVDLSETGVVRISKRPLTITAKSGEWTYDGFNHSLESDNQPLSCEGLAPGEQLVSVAYNASITNAGEKENGIDISDIRILEKGTSQRASLDNYDIKVIPGKLKVLKRDITITTPTITRQYDGKDLKGASATAVPKGSNLIDGHEIRYDEESLPSIVDFGPPKDNEFECTIVDGISEIDVSENYNISYRYGVLTITKRTLRITTPTHVKEFDGETLYGFEDKEEIYCENLVATHTLVVPANKDELPKVVNVDKISNTFEIKVSDSSGDVTNNYDIIYTYGYLEVTRLNVKVKTKSQTLPYNGKELSNNDTEFINLPTTLTPMLVEEKYPSVTNVGRVENAVTFTLSSGGVPVGEENYHIDYTYGYLEITPYKFSLKLRDYNLTYDGSVLNLDELTGDKDPLDGNVFSDILPREAFKLVTSKNVISDVGSYSYTAELAAGYDISNYEIKISGGAIEIAKCVVVVNLTPVNKMYDNAVWSPANIDVIDFKALDGGTLSHLDANSFVIVASSNEVKNAGDYTYTVQFADATDEKNHILHIVGGHGYVHIDKFKLHDTLADTVTYNGKSQIPAVEDVIKRGLPFDLTYDNFRVVLESGDAVNVNQTAFTYRVNMVSGDIGNYDVNITGTRLINKAQAQLNAKSGATVSKTYNGEPFIVTSEHVNFATAAVDYFTYTVNCSTPSADVNNDGYSLVINSSVLSVFNERGENITSNFRFTQLNMKVKITPMNITFTLENYFCKSSNVPRDEIDLIGCFGVSSLTPLLAGFSIVFVNDYGEQIGLEELIDYSYNTGIFEFDAFSFIRIYDNKGNDATKNFNITNGDEPLTASIITSD